jgi:hypothetical protein
LLRLLLPLNDKVYRKNQKYGLSFILYNLFQILFLKGIMKEQVKG